jgi:uncharacterized protein YbaR (Trm112 family)
MPIDSQLLALLKCPADRAALRDDGDRLTCDGCGRRYPVRDTIPVLLIEEAEQQG